MNNEEGPSQNFQDFPSTNIKIVISQRSMLTEEDNKRRAKIFYQTLKKVEIIPYDRFLEIEI